MTWGCIAGILSGHHWQKWESVSQGYLGSPETDPLTGNKQTAGKPIGFWEKQRRICLLCGKVQLRVAKS